MLPESDFPSVLQAARLGADWAWGVIYRELAPAVLRYLRARGASEPDDLLGEVFVQVVRNIPRFEGEADEFRSWVFLIAHNRLIDDWRKAGRQRIEAAPEEVLLRHGGTADAEHEAMHRIADARVRDTLARLTPDQRDVLFLRILGRLTIEETASVLGKTPGAVKSLQARGVATIRRRISKEAVSL